MQLLTVAEQSRWLADRQLPADPYAAGGDVFQFYLQFYPPENFRGVESFIKGFLEYAGRGSDLMVTVMDTVNPDPYELRLFDRLRTLNEERRRLLDTPVHLFEPTEDDDVIAMFTLTVAFQWQAYLHVPKTRTVLYNWEGDIFDFWTADRLVFESVSRMLDTFELKQTKGGNGH